MSNWTHVAGIVRLDCFRFADKLGPDFLNTQFIIACLSDFVANNPKKKFYLDNGLVMSTQNLGQMNSTKKEVSYKYAVLKNRIK